MPAPSILVTRRDSDCNNDNASNGSSGSKSDCSGSSSGIGSSSISRRKCCSSGLSIVLLTLLVTSVTAAAAAGATTTSTAAIAGDESGQHLTPTQQPLRLHSLYHEIPHLKLYKACGLPLVLLLSRKCSRRGGVYLVEADPKFAYLTAKHRERQNATQSLLHSKLLAKINVSPRHLCFRSNYGVKNPFIDCCCNYCTERTVLSYCRPDSRSRFSARISG